MPGIVIHLAIGKQYIKKHKNDIINEKEFLRGIIAPDLNEDFTGTTKNKSKMHYGKWGDYDNYEVITNIDEFLNDEKVDINLEYWKGYFLHLFADHYFYNIDFKEEFEEIIKNKDKFYKDWDSLNKYLIDRYKIEKIKHLEKYMKIIDTEPKYLEPNKIIRFIEKISDINIEEQAKIIKENGMEGLK